MRFHAFQSIFLSVVLIVASWLITSVFWRLGGLIELLFYAPFIYLLVQTLQGKKIVLPVIGELAEKQAR